MKRKSSASRSAHSSRRCGALGVCAWALRARLQYAILFALLLLAPAVAQAQNVGGGVRIGVIDAQRILSESFAVISLSEKVEKLRNDYQREFRGSEKSVRESDRNLALRRPLLDPSAYLEGRRALEFEATNLQLEFQARMREVDTIFRQGMAQVHQQLALVTGEIANEQDLDLVLAKATVVLARPDLDITDEALHRLNERLPEVILPELEASGQEP